MMDLFFNPLSRPVQILGTMLVCMRVKGAPPVWVAILIFKVVPVVLLQGVGEVPVLPEEMHKLAVAVERLI